MKEPVTQDIGDRQAFMKDVLVGVRKKVAFLVVTTCDALHYEGRQRHHLEDRVTGAMQAYVFYRSGIEGITEQDVRNRFELINQGIGDDLATALKQRLEFAVDDVIDEKLKKLREGGRKL